MKPNPSPSTPLVKDTPAPELKIMGRDWSEIQAMQQGQNVAKHLPPVNAEKMKAAIMSDVARFKIPVAVEVVNELGIELPASYKLVGGTWIHSDAPAPASSVKDTPDFSGLAPIFDKAELASRKTAAAPALPVASVGVPALLQAVLEKANETLPGKRVACQSDFRKDIQTALTKALASHAAKDIKIRALEAVASKLSEWEKDPDSYGGDLADLAFAARAALALPCA